MPLPFSGTAARLEKPVKRMSFFGTYEMVLERGCWDEWLESGDYLGWGRVVLSLDHMLGTLSTLAATDNGTLGFQAAGDFLVFEGSLVQDGDDPGPTQAQADVAKLAAQKLQKQVSIGFSIEKGHWEWRDDEDNDLEFDRLVCEKILIRELSLVPYGAMGDDATIGMKQQMALTFEVGEDKWKLGGCGVKLYKTGSNNVELDVDAWHKTAKDKWQAERFQAKLEADDAAAEKSSGEGAATVMTVTEARALARSHRRQ